MPIVMLARRVKGFETDYVGGDNYAGSVAATNHLLVTHGARRPAFIGGHVYSSAREERLGGFLSAREFWASRCRCEISRRVCRTGSWPAMSRPN